MYNHKLIIFVLFLFIPLILNSQDKPPVIEVTGNAEIKIEADMMEVSIYVNVDDEDLISAKNKNDESTKKVLEALKDLNIEDKDIVTSGISMSKQNDTYNKRLYYTVANWIMVKTPDISAYEGIMTKLIRIENVYVNNITLSSTKAIETRVKAREDALLAAKKKAEDMAAIFGMSIGKPVLITETSDVYYPNPFNVSTQNVNQSVWDRSQDLFKAGLVSVTASVKVVFALIDK